MSQSRSRIPSPSRSQGAPITPRRHRTRRTLSVASPAGSDASGRLTNVVEQYLKNDKFTVSPLRRRSVLPDDTDIEMPRRASWWKKLDGSSRDILEALDTNQMPGNLLEEYEFEVPLEKQTVQTLPENSDNDSVASIVVPQRRLFNQKKQTREKFGDIAGSRKSLGRTLLDDQDQTIKELPKNLFSKGQPRNRPVFPDALLNSTNKTINKTVEPEPNKPARNLFGQAGMKRKNMFTDFVLSESEDDSLVQHKVFGFKKDNKRISLASRNRRMPSLTPSVTTDIDIDDWNLLPSSTMIGNGSGAMEESRIITDKEIEQAQDENQDVTLTEANESLKPGTLTVNNSTKSKKSKSLSRTRLSKSRKLDDDFDKTLTNENIETEEASKHNTESEAKNSSRHNKTVLSETRKDKTIETKTLNQVNIADDQALKQNKKNDINEQTADNEPSIEEKMAELHKEIDDERECHVEPIVEQGSDKEIIHEHQNVENREEVSSNEQDATKEPESSKEITNEEKDNTQEMESSKEITNDEQDDTLEPESSKEITNDEQDDTKEPESSKEITNDEHDDTKEPESSKEVTNDEHEEEMEPMVWSDDNTEKANVHDENEVQGEESNENDDENIDEKDGNNEQEVSDQATPVKEIPDKIQQIVESADEEEDQIEHENDVLDETPNTSYDTTGRKRNKRETVLKSPETVLKNTSKEDMSFKPMGRSTSFRKSKSAIEDINVRPTLIPIQESTIASEGSRNSSTEGSGWDSHRTTRQTLRQTFGKDFTPRKSLRALVMEQSAKRQMEVEKNASKANKTKDKTVLEDVADHNIRDRRVSTNLSSDQLPDPKSPVPDISTHHVTDPLISKPQVSYYKSVHDINEQTITHHEKSANIQDNDSGPEISIDASYGQGMSREASEHENDLTVDKTKHREKSNLKITANIDYIPMEIDEVIEEELDYDPSVQDSHDAEDEISEKERSEEFSENEERDNSAQQLSDNDEEENQDSEQEIESEEERESEQELEDEESQRNLEAESDEEHEESQHEVEVESEQEDNEMSQQNIEAESDEEHEKSQQEVEVESEQEDNEMSQQEIEMESEAEEQQESENEVDPDSENESENERVQLNASQESVNNVSNQESEQESDRDVSDAHEIELDSDNEDNDQSEVLIKRIVFDNEMSDQEIEYEVSDRISRQITEDEVSEHVSDAEAQEISVSRFSEPAKELDESIGTKKSMLLMQMQRIAQKNMEIKMKAKEQVKNSLKQTSLNAFMPMQSKFPTRRVTRPEAKKTKYQARKMTVAIGALPKEFVDDLNYKPPKRYQPATAPWITKRLYKFLEAKLEPKYDYRARVRAEELVLAIHGFAKLLRRRDAAPPAAVDALKREMARLNVVRTHFDFYEFFHDFMPREVRIKVNPDVANRIPVPRNIFGDIL